MEKNCKVTEKTHEFFGRAAERGVVCVSYIAVRIIVVPPSPPRKIFFLCKRPCLLIFTSSVCDQPRQSPKFLSHGNRTIFLNENFKKSFERLLLSKKLLDVRLVLCHCVKRSSEDNKLLFQLFR